MQEVAEQFEVDSNTFNTVAQKAVQAFQASEAAKKARELVRRKNAIVRSTLPGKLADCSSTDMASSEIFIVEGDSAGEHLFADTENPPCRYELLLDEDDPKWYEPSKDQSSACRLWFGLWLSHNHGLENGMCTVKVVTQVGTMKDLWHLWFL